MRAISLLACSLLSVHSAAQSIERVSVGTGGAQANGASRLAAISDDGNIIAFDSQATNLSVGDSVLADVYVHDRAAGTTVRISAADPMAVGVSPIVSGDGRWVVYTKLGISGPLAFGSILVFDRTSGTTQTLPSTATEDFFAFDVTPDGRYVFAEGSVPAASPNRQIWRIEVATGARTIVSTGPAGVPANGSSFTPVTSDDGQRIAFESRGTNLTPGVTVQARRVYLRDLAANTTTLVSVRPDGTSVLETSSNPTISADGFLVGFYSLSDELDFGDTNGVADVFLRDLANVTTTRVSVGTGASESNQESFRPWLAANGTRVSFLSFATNLAPGDTNGFEDIFVRDLGLETTVLATSLPAVVQANGGAENLALSSDGRWLLLSSMATNLVAGDTNGVEDIFLVDLGPRCSTSSYCSANPNSTGLPASIGSSGDPSFTLDNFTLNALDLPAQAAGVFFMGNQAIDPGVPFGAGLLCVGGTLRRLGVTQAVGGAVIQGQDLGSSAYQGLRAGDTRYIQLLYRDVTALGFNTSNALAVTFCY